MRNVTKTEISKMGNRNERKIIASRNYYGIGSSDWRFTEYKNESQARSCLVSRAELASEHNDGWDTHLILLNAEEAIKLT